MVSIRKKQQHSSWKTSFFGRWSCPTASLILPVVLLLLQQEIGNAFLALPPSLLSAPSQQTTQSVLQQRNTMMQLQRPTDGRWKRSNTAVAAAVDDDDNNDDVEEEDLGTTVIATTATASRTMQVDLKTEVSNSFLQYSLSIILGRALPDARDGLKPVHRRILYSMYQLNLSANTPHRKCARVVGDVLGKLHPHGDQAVYDALVRMAQDFNSHYPLIDGHGNFGSIDADPAAAMRYTECRLTTLAQESLLDELNKSSGSSASQIVDFTPNFDGTEQEPSVLPSKLPFLLLNGSSGIAVGMATNIPPHNLREILTACIAFLSARQAQDDNNDDNDAKTSVSDQELLKMVPAPDFPTGGIIMGTSGAKQLYLTGNGGVTMRAKTMLEKIRHKKTSGSSSHTQRNAIIVTELPYQVNKAALLEKIASLVNDKKLEGIADLRDESDRDGIRMVIELKRDAVAAVVLNNLYKKTPLQSSFSGNLVSLMHPKTSPDDFDRPNSLVPQRFTLREALDYFLDFRYDTLRRKSELQLKNAMARRHIVEGLLLALEKVDDVVDVIRKSDDATRDLQDLLGGASKEQVQAVLRLQLGQLSRLNKDKLQNEADDLVATCEQLQTLLTNPNAVYESIKTELTQLRNKYGTERQSIIQTENAGDLADIDLIENSRSVIVVTRGGYIKRMELKDFESQGRGTRGKRSTSSAPSADNEIAHCFTCNDHDTILMVTQNGIAYSLVAYQIPKASRTAKGAPIPSVLPVTVEDVITAVLPIVSEFAQKDYSLVLTTKNGSIKRTPLKAFSGITARGLTVATLEPNDKLLWCGMCTNDDTILVGSTMGKATRFRAQLVTPTGRKSRGVRSMKLSPGDSIADVNVLKQEDVTMAAAANADASLSVLAITSGGFGKRMLVTEFRDLSRNCAGVIATKFKNKDDRMRCLRIVHEDDEILVITAKGIIVRLQASEISLQSRGATGVMVQKLDEGDEISSVSLVPKHDE